MTTRTLTIVSAGLGQPSSTRLLGERIADAAASALEQKDVEVVREVVELRDHARDLTNNLLTFSASDELQAVKDVVVGSDGLIAVSPVYSASYSGLFKTFFDLIDRGSLDDLPVALGATGGTPRHSLALDHAMRPLFAHLRAATVPTAVYAASQDWGDHSGDGEAHEALQERIVRAGEQLAGMVLAREKRTVVDPYAVTVPFDQLRTG